MDNRNDKISLGEIFDKMKPGDPEVIVNINLARSKSVGGNLVPRKTVLEKIDILKLRKSIVTIVIAGVISLPLLNSMANKINISHNMGEMSVEIASILGSDGRMSLVGMDTERRGNICYYKHEKIAKDLLSLDSNIFNYAFGAVCHDMSTDINNIVSSDGMSNIEVVISYLRMYSRQEGKYYSGYVSEMFKDVNTLDDYLIKNGHVDKAGNPSIEAFMEHCGNNLEYVLGVINSEKESKGANL